MDHHVPVFLLVFKILDGNRTPFIKDTSLKLNTSSMKHKRGHRTRNDEKEGVQNRSIKRRRVQNLIIDKGYGQKCN